MRSAGPTNLESHWPNWCILLSLWVIPLTVYLMLIGRWSLSGDEYYTLVDSSKPVDELLSYERKPLYYLICHVLLKLGFNYPTEFLLRLPAAIAASLIPPAFYAISPPRQGSSYAVLVAIIAFANPWLLEVSQFARFYSLAFLFSTIASLSMYRWFCARRIRGSAAWLVSFLLFGLLAALAHTPAGIVLPAGVIAVSLAICWENPQQFVQFLRRYGLRCGIILLVCLIGGIVFVKSVLDLWWNAEAGQFGNYTVTQILVALALFGGLSTWSLAIFPLVKLPSRWTAQEVFLVAMLSLATLPFLALVPFGGGIASRYLMYGLPCMFVLAGSHWSTIQRLLPSRGYRVGLAAGLLSFNLPFVASVMSDGNHHDYRGIARELESLQLDNPIIVASAHAMLDYYYRRQSTIEDMETFENGVPRPLLEERIALAVAQHRPLVLVSREDRTNLSTEDQAWLFARFALVRQLQSQRFDHRRFRMSIYQYRPAGESSTTSPKPVQTQVLAGDQYHETRVSP